MNTEESKKYHHDYHKAWYQTNKEKRKKQLKEYAQTHKEDFVRRTQKYVAKNKEKVYAYGHQYNRTVGGLYRMYKSGALKKGNDFALSMEDFALIVLEDCRYCGENTKRIGIDRIDNSKGYVLGNCAPCCKLCNYMKKNHTVDDFLIHIKKIYKYNEN